MADIIDIKNIIENKKIEKYTGSITDIYDIALKIEDEIDSCEGFDNNNQSVQDTMIIVYKLLQAAYDASHGITDSPYLSFVDAAITHEREITKERKKNDIN